MNLEKKKEHRKINHPVKPPSSQHSHSTAKVCHVFQHAEYLRTVLAGKGAVMCLLAAPATGQTLGSCQL